MAIDKKYLYFIGIVILLSVLISNTPIAEKWELWAYDYRLNTAGNIKKLDNRIRIIGIDEGSLHEFGQWPWPRKIHAGLVDKLTKLSADVIIYDILFDSPDSRGSENDKIFAESMKKSGRVILPFEFKNKGYLTGAESVFPVEVLKNSARELGFVDNLEDIDGKVRKVCLAFSSKNKIYPSLDIVSFAFVRGVRPDEIKYLPDKIIIKDIAIPTDKDYTIYINFAGREMLGGESFSNAFTPIGVKKIFELKEDNNLYSDSLCYIGATSEGLKDFFTTPAGYLSGIAIHANVLNCLLQKKFIVKIKPIYEIIIWIVIGLIGIILFPKFKATKCTALFIILAVIYTIINFFLFYLGYLFNLTHPLLFLFFLFTFVQAYQFMRTHKLFGQFVAQEIVDEMLAKECKQKLGGQEKEVTILFSDIRGYTSLSEGMNPKEVIDLLNEYHGRMIKIFSQNKGRIFDYQGDAQMVVFGAPIEAKDHAYLAIKAAFEMRSEIEKLKKEWRQNLPIEFNVGIGICTGIVAIGLVGAEEHKQYSAIGDSTNVASRMQSLSKELGCNILVTQSTYNLVKDKVTAKLFKDILVKGKAEPMNVYGIIEMNQF